MRFYPLNGCAVRCPPPEAGIFRLSRQARGRSLQPFLSRFPGEGGRSRRGEAAHGRAAAVDQIEIWAERLNPATVLIVR